MILRVCAADLPVLERERPRLVGRLSSGVDLRLVADDSVGAGGCIIETPVAKLDARLASQLDAIERGLGKKVPPGSSPKP